MGKINDLVDAINILGEAYEENNKNSKVNDIEKIKQDRKLIKEYGFKGLEGVIPSKKEAKKSANKAYATFKKAVVEVAEARFKFLGKFAAKTVFKAGEVAVDSAYRLNKKAHKIAVATTKKSLKESEKLTVDSINLASNTMRKSVDIAFTAMKDPVDALGSSIDTIGNSMQSIGSKLGPIGKAIGDSFGGIVSQFSKFETGALKEFTKVDDAAHKMQKSFGLSEEQTREYRDESLKAASLVAQQWGKTYNDVVKAQTKFAESTGKNIVFGTEDYNDYFGLSQLAGEDNAAGLTAGLQDFNQDVSSVSDMYMDMYKNVQKTGVSIEKTTKDVLNNLKLANKYNFKEGSKSIMEMAVWANKTKFNLSSIGGIIDKVSGGGVESAITSSAQLQVLGGQFGIQSDPLGMLYDTLEDPESLAKRVQKMAASQGRFDEETGETKLSGNAIRMLQASAKALGISPEEMNVMAKEATRRTQVEKQLSPSSGLTEEQKTLIASKAQWDKESKQFYVTDIKGNKTFTKNIDQSNIKNMDLAPEMNNEEKLVDYAGKTLSQVDEIAKVVAGKTIKDAVAGKVQEGLFNELIDTTNKSMDVIYSSIGGILNEVSGSLTKMAGEFLPLITEVMETITPLIPEIIKMFESVLSVLSDTVVPLFGKISGPMIDMANAVIPILSDIAKSVSPIVELFMTNLVPIVKMIGDAVVPIIQKILPIVEKVLNSIGPIIEKIIKILTPFIDAVLPVLDEIMTQFFNITDTLIDVIGPIVKIFGNIMPALQSFFKNVGPAIATGIKLIGGGLKDMFRAIQPAINDLIISLGESLPIFIDVISRVLAIVMQVIAPILKIIADLISTVVKVLSQILNDIYILIKPALDVISQLLNVILDSITWVLDKISYGIRWIFDKIDWLFKKITNGISDFMYSLLDKIPSFSPDSWFDSMINDGIVTGNKVVKTDSDDQIIAAKTGGPFDMFFNDMNNKLDEIYKGTDEQNKLNESVLSDGGIKSSSAPTIVKVSPIGNNSREIEVNNKSVNINGRGQNSLQNNGNISISPINVNINGKLDLTSGGESIDIMNILKNNPMLIRKITEMIVEQVGSNINGGKTELFRNRYTL